MDMRGAILVENELYKSVESTYELDSLNKKEREIRIKKLVLDYCKENEIDVGDAIEKLKSMFEFSRKRNPNQSYPGTEKLEEMVLGKKTETKKETEER